MQIIRVTKVLLLEVVLVSFISACNSETHGRLTIVVTRDTSKISLNVLVKEIADYSTVDEEHVGIAGITSELYKRFQNFTKRAKETELIELTNHVNPTVRAYAVWALVKRNYSGLKSVLESKKDDTASIIHFSGCTKMEYPIKEFYTTIINRR